MDTLRFILQIVYTQNNVQKEQYQMETDAQGVSANAVPFVYHSITVICAMINTALNVTIIFSKVVQHAVLLTVYLVKEFVMPLNVKKASMKVADIASIVMSLA